MALGDISKGKQKSTEVNIDKNATKGKMMEIEKS
mgnify:CR=1 FL=1